MIKMPLQLLHQHWFKQAPFILLLFGISFSSSADHFILNKEQSSISFVSTKKSSIAETHVFKDYSGEIIEGKARITLLPDSIESGIDIRNERMREFLFKTGIFPKISISAESDAINNLEVGVPSNTSIPATLSLHGFEQDIRLDVSLLLSSSESLIITSQKPVIINAADYEMSEGINKLGTLAGGLEITTAIPTYFSLVFDKH